MRLGLLSWLADGTLALFFMLVLRWISVALLPWVHVVIRGADGPLRDILLVTGLQVFDIFEELHEVTRTLLPARTEPQPVGPAAFEYVTDGVVLSWSLVVTHRSHRVSLSVHLSAPRETFLTRVDIRAESQHRCC